LTGHKDRHTIALYKVVGKKSTKNQNKRGRNHRFITENSTKTENTCRCYLFSVSNAGLLLSYLLTCMHNILANVFFSCEAVNDFSS